MSNKALKVTISKKDLNIVIGRACLAAMTSEGQSEISKAGNASLGCVRIEASGDSIVFESSVSRFASQHIVKVGEGSEASIESAGVTRVPVKELKTVASAISDDYMVSIAFVEKPVDQGDVSSPIKAILPNGVVQITAIKGSKSMAGVEIEAYPDANGQQYPSLGELNVILSGKASCVKTPYGLVGFAINPGDPKETYNKFAIFASTEAVFFLGADGRRCAVVESKGDTFEKFIGIELETPILIEVEYLNPVLSSIPSEEPFVLAVDPSEERVYVLSGGTTYRINMVNKTFRSKYPNYKKIMGLKEGTTISINRKDFSMAAGLLKTVNPDRATHRYDCDRSVIALNSKGLTAIKKATGEVEFKTLSDTPLKGNEICLHTMFVIEGLKKMVGENVKMAFTPDEARVKIQDETDPQFLYFMQVMTKNEV